ncbi:hypothetical protein ABZ599_16225 [Streptomyces misionensis]|uniref:AAA family ATPase n=1 Tax=Streptomyces misionensis TaxID=67331 RepID=UPI0033C3CA1C
MLAAADLGVDAVEIDPADGEVKLAHTAVGGRSVLLEWAMESSGTRALMLVLERVLWALEHGSVILIDGLGSPLHPLLTAEITTLFVASWSNLRHAQLLCTSHAVAILGGARHGQSLEPHHVWLAERGLDGSTEVYPPTAAKSGKGEALRLGPPGTQAVDPPRQLAGVVSESRRITGGRAEQLRMPAP